MRLRHKSISVLNLERSVAFYRKALGLREDSRMQAPDGSFVIATLGDGGRRPFHQLELTWLRDQAGPYELGENEDLIAFEAGDYEAARTLHKQMDCICYENKKTGVYFICDPDGYWIEILPKKA